MQKLIQICVKICHFPYIIIMLVVNIERKNIWLKLITSCRPKKSV